MEEETQPKWEGKASVELKGTKAEQVWPFLEDFCNIHKWFPNLDTSYQVEGVLGQPGLIRYCASTTNTSSSDSSDGTTSTVAWAKEKLLMINPIQRCFSYEVIDNNMGFKSYVATIKVLPINGVTTGRDDDDGKSGCKIEWSYVADPVEGWKFEDLSSYIEFCLQFMAKKMEHALLSSGSE